MKQCLEKANRLSPNNEEIMFTMSQFYQFKKYDLSNALKFNQLAVNCGGMKPMFVSNLIQLMYKIDRSKDLTSEFDKFISKAETTYYRNVCMCLKARYLLQEMQCNLKVVLEIFENILKDPECLLQMVRKLFFILILLKNLNI